MEGEKYLRAAQQESTKTSCCGGNSEFKANAANLYQKAGLEFKKASQFNKSGGAWTEAAKCWGAAEEGIDESESYANAAEMYMLAAEASDWVEAGSIKEAIDAYDVAMQHVDSERVRVMAVMMKSMVDLKLRYAVLVRADEKLYKSTVNAAISMCGRAADLFRQNGENIEAQDLLVKSARSSSEYLEEYQKAIEIFEKVNKECLGGIAADADMYFLDATLVRFAAKEPVSDTRHRVEQYCLHENPRFDNPPHAAYVFLRDIEAALREKSKAQLDMARENYIKKNSVSLDNWRRVIFERIRDGADVVDPMDVDLG